jgi:Mrp family chromosome partitioning ATPase
VAVVAAAAYLVAGRSASNTYRAEARLHVVNTVVSYDPQGDAVPEAVIPRLAGEVNPAEFLVHDVAAKAAATLGAPRPTPETLLARLTFAPISPTEINLLYTTRSRADAAAVLETYVDEYIRWKRSQQERALSDALESVRASLRALPKAGQVPSVNGGTAANFADARRLELQAHVDKLKLALDLIPQQVAPVGSVNVSLDRKGLRPSVAIAGGGLAGFALGLLLALLLARFDPRVRSSSDLDVPGITITDIESGDSPASMQRLRSELELTGLGRDFSVIVVTAATRAESRTATALGLAEAFASVGTQTVVLSADVGAVADGENVVPLLKSGVSTFLDGTSEQLAAAEVADNLVWVPKGESHAGTELRISSAQIDQLLLEARELGHVVVVDAPPVAESGALLFAAAADVTVLVVQRARTTWSSLTTGFARLQSARRGSLHICFDRSRGRGRRSEPDPEVAADPRRVSSRGAVRP